MMKTSASAWRTKASSNCTDGGRALRVDVDQDVHPLVQVAQDRLTQRAVIFSMDLGVLEKLSGLDAREKIRLGKKMIIFAIDLAGARRASRAGNGINEIGSLAERVTERRFPRAGWSRDDEKNAVAAEFLTQDFEFVRVSSPLRTCRPRRGGRFRRRPLSRLTYSVPGKFPE